MGANTLTMNVGSSQTFSGIITGSGSLIKNNLGINQGLRIEIIKAGSHDFRPEDFAQCSTLAFGFERSFARV